jgi:hypothetical protein
MVGGATIPNTSGKVIIPEFKGSHPQRLAIECIPAFGKITTLPPPVYMGFKAFMSMNFFEWLGSLCIMGEPEAQCHEKLHK